MSALSNQVGGSHYKDKKIQPIEFIHANGLGHIEGSIVKYISRWRDKGGIQDLEKIKHYVDLLIELETPKDCDIHISSEELNANLGTMLWCSEGPIEDE